MSPYPLDPVDATGPMRLVVTAAPVPAAETLATGALEHRLAACVSVLSIRSVYWWKGTVERAEEELLLFKTAPKRVGALFQFLATHHPYEVPEIFELDVPRVHEPYLRYLAETIDPGAPPLPLGGGDPARLRRPGSRRGRGARGPGRTRAPRRRR
ncbi:MAG TPA: divalent-cation tolerance protein CutA [Thermoplasmata archaeon]|nr:divalent-cation tolerance protein CutA [Thermoplasmata archaeon]